MNKKGFTLVELLAVVVILGLLIVLTSTSVLSIMKSTKNNLKQKEFNSLLEAGKTYINDVIDKNNSITPQTTNPNPTSYTGYAFLEYVGTCNDTTATNKKYCKRVANTDETDNIEETITRTIYFDSYALKDYIDLSNYNIDYSDEDNPINACKLKAEITVDLNSRGYYILNNINIVKRDGVSIKRCVK